jgi:hypothetical protein
MLRTPDKCLEVRRQHMTASMNSWEWQPESVSRRFVSYARAYLNAANGVCRGLVKNPQQFAFPDASVVLLLAAHSVELFLKGAILARNESFDIVTHRLADLHREFDRLFPEAQCRWEPPFRTEYVGFSEQEAAALARCETPPSIRYRYPTDNSKHAWQDVHSFTPEVFRLTLDETSAAYDRIEKFL